LSDRAICSVARLLSGLPENRSAIARAWYARLELGARWIAVRAS
jgi:hypothetical protein